MKTLIICSIIVALFGLCGCEYIAPSVSKALTEKEQQALLEEQIEVQRDIADSLRAIASSMEQK